MRSFAASASASESGSAVSRALPSPLSSEASAAVFDDPGLWRRLRARCCVAYRLRAPGLTRFRSHLAYARTFGDCDYAQLRPRASDGLADNLQGSAAGPDTACRARGGDRRRGLWLFGGSWPGLPRYSGALAQQRAGLRWTSGLRPRSDGKWRSLWGAPATHPQDNAEYVLKALDEAAPALRDVWLEHAWTWNEEVGEDPSTPGGSGVVIDRRAVSLGTKWRVENEELIELRQGLAVSIEEREGDGVIVRTVFGEEFPGRVALVAVGLALGGRICVAEQETPGGRYGEVAADALLDQLRSQGARFETVEIPVGARLRSADSALRMVGVLADRVGGCSVDGASSGALLVQVTLTPLARPEDASASRSESEATRSATHLAHTKVQERGP